MMQKTRSLVSFCVSTPGRALLQLSLAFLTMFTAWNGVGNILTSISVGNSGFISLLIMYGALSTSAVLVAPLVLGHLSLRRAMAGASLFYALFQLERAVNLPGAWGMTTFMAASLLLGSAGAALWTAQGTYLALAARRYAASRGDEPASSMGLFQGVFFGCQQASMFFGNVLVSLVMGFGAEALVWLFTMCTILSVLGTVILSFMPDLSVADDSSKAETDAAALASDSDAAACNAAERGEMAAEELQLLDSERPDSDRPDSDTESDQGRGSESDSLDLDPYVDREPLRLLDIPRRASSGTEVQRGYVQRVKSILKILFSPEMVFLGLGFFYGTLALSWISGTFTKFVITAAVGAEKIGWIMALYGLALGGGSMALGRVADASRVAVLLIVALLHTSFYCLVLYMEFRGDLVEVMHNRPLYLYLLAMLFGLGHSGCYILPNALFAGEFAHKLEDAYAAKMVVDAGGGTFGFLVFSVTSLGGSIGVCAVVLLLFLLVASLWLRGYGKSCCAYVRASCVSQAA